MVSIGERSTGPLSRVTRGVSGLIGLATEIHAQRQSKKVVHHKELESIDNEIPNDQGCSVRPGTQPIEREPPPEYTDRPTEIKPLPRPVIIPQRRPNTKSRGFARAYAPDLWHYKCINEQSFLDFLEEFHKSSQASPVFQVINLAAIGAGFAPSAIAIAVSLAVTAASNAAIEVQSRIRTNNYLDKVNQEFFHPKNLHCMIMTFKPDRQENIFLDLDSNHGPVSAKHIIPGVWPALSTCPQTSPKENFRQSDGVSHGQLEIPQAAQLIYVEKTTRHDPVSSQETDGNTTGLKSSQERNSSSWKDTRKFVSEYKDRRAQATFAGKYGQESTLAVPGATDPAKFASRFSDPNHPVNSGHPLALLTGGKFRNSDDVKMRLVQLTGRQSAPSSEGRVVSGVKSMVESRNGSSSGLIGAAKDMMKSDILYLLIAEIPTAAEMDHLLGHVELR
ncbi:hypothetical protein LTR84_004291 [Exophiala bonariae]|uniref:Uncharacterized protein n=1 Tax=Exophiala bonariae TaxID=1690606 RepID=A0AAV9N7P7_9EURO|nr:hypothetical protein LTR84_004291 [Exophiala bonariae]